MRLNSKLEVLEQRQAASAQLASESAHAHTLQTKQMERSIEEHHQQHAKSISKAELRGQDMAEQIAHKAVADSQANMQVSSCYSLHRHFNKFCIQRLTHAHMKVMH